MNVTIGALNGANHEGFANKKANRYQKNRLNPAAGVNAIVRNTKAIAKKK